MNIIELIHDKSDGLSVLSMVIDVLIIRWYVYDVCECYHES